jgi:hypothetical protein
MIEMIWRWEIKERLLACAHDNQFKFFSFRHVEALPSFCEAVGTLSMVLKIVARPGHPPGRSHATIDGRAEI